MFFFFSKLLPLVLYPVGLTLLLIAAALLLRRRRRLQTGLLAGALLLLLLGSNRWVALGLAAALERQHPPLTLPVTADAIVVLGGATRIASPPRPIPELNEAGDRLLYAAWLYQQQAAPLLLLTGGGVPDPEPISEAQSMADVLAIMGVPPEAVILEETSRNTAENAANSRPLLAAAGARTIILVTSATHMPRAAAVFEAQGLTVLPAPTDFVSSSEEWRSLRSGPPLSVLFGVLPDAENLAVTTRCLKEYLGLFIYRLRGWR